MALGYNISESWKTSLRGRNGHFVVEDPGTVIEPTHGSLASVGIVGANGSGCWFSTKGPSSLKGPQTTFSPTRPHSIAPG